MCLLNPAGIGKTSITTTLYVPGTSSIQAQYNAPCGVPYYPTLAHSWPNTVIWVLILRLRDFSGLPTLNTCARVVERIWFSLKQLHWQCIRRQSDVNWTTSRRANRSESTTQLIMVSLHSGIYSVTGTMVCYGKMAVDLRIWSLREKS